MHPNPPPFESSLVHYLSGWGALGLVRTVAEDAESVRKWLAEHADANTVHDMISYVEWLAKVRGVADLEAYLHAVQELVFGLLAWRYRERPASPELVSAAQTVNDMLRDGRWSWPAAPPTWVREG